MKKNTLVVIVVLLFFLIILGIGKIIVELNKEVNNIEGLVINKDDKEITLQDNKDSIYTFKNNNILVEVGDMVKISYEGSLDNEALTDSKIVDYEVYTEEVNEYGIPMDYLDDGIFSQYYILAFDKLQTMTLEEKIGQLILGVYVRSTALVDLDNYKLSGFLFYKTDFTNKDEEQVKDMIQELQDNADIPLLMAVDEEGGSVVRISSNNKLVSEKFKSPGELYELGGFELIKEDTIYKSKVLNNLGINLNLAPVVDIVSEDDAYMFRRTIGLGIEGTSEYAKTVIQASKGTNVSYTLKHFPGYGNADDSHISKTYVYDTYEQIINNYLPPFLSGINSGAEAVLINHSIYTSIDDVNPATLSPTIHNILRNNLDFTGVVITDKMNMISVVDVDDMYLKAILAGNNLIITSDHSEAFNQIMDGINNGILSEKQIDKLAFKILAWKYYKGLLYGIQK